MGLWKAILSVVLYIAHFLMPLSFALFYLKVTQFSQFSVFSMEFSGKLQMVFCFFLLPP